VGISSHDIEIAIFQKLTKNPNTYGFVGLKGSRVGSNDLIRDGNGNGIVQFRQKSTPGRISCVLLCITTSHLVVTVIIVTHFFPLAVSQVQCCITVTLYLRTTPIQYLIGDLCPLTWLVIYECYTVYY
jgi:hypothetical protein